MRSPVTAAVVEWSNPGIRAAGSSAGAGGSDHRQPAHETSRGWRPALYMRPIPVMTRPGAAGAAINPARVAGGGSSLNAALVPTARGGLASGQQCLASCRSGCPRPLYQRSGGLPVRSSPLSLFAGTVAAGVDVRCCGRQPQHFAGTATGDTCRRRPVLCRLLLLVQQSRVLGVSGRFFFLLALTGPPLQWLCETRTSVHRLC